MARQLRIEFAGGLYHVTRRGNARQSIFRDDVDRRCFLELLGACVKKFDWILTAYVLMTNHYHIAVQLTCETLSRGLKWLNGSYGSYFNQRHSRTGHIFERRPDIQLVEKEGYSTNVLRYAVLNPVRAGSVPRPEDYEWSSHRAIIGVAEAPAWLAVDDALAQFASDRGAARALYREYVDAGIGVRDDFWKNLIGGMYLGRDEWLAAMRDKVELRPRSDDHPRLQRNVGVVAMADVVATVAQMLNLTETDVRARRTPRLIAAWLASNEAFLTCREIAAGLRLRSRSHVSRLVHESERVISGDERLQTCIDRCVSTIRGKQGKREL